MPDLRLSIHQTLAQIGVRTNWGSQSIHSPHGDLSIRQPQAEMQIKTQPGRLTVDSSAAWDALGHGGNLSWSSRIYSESKEIALQGIARTAKEGDRIADLQNPSNPFADIARQRARSNPPSVSYTGPASNRNVKLHYEPGSADIRITPRHPEIKYTPHKPEAVYHRGSVDTYVKRPNTIDIHVSKYDLYS